jgi:hypothetical protein
MTAGLWGGASAPPPSFRSVSSMTNRPRIVPEAPRNRASAEPKLGGKDEAMPHEQDWGTRQVQFSSPPCPRQETSHVETR